MTDSGDSEQTQSGEYYSLTSDPIDAFQIMISTGTYEIIDERTIIINQVEMSYCSQGQARKQKRNTAYEYEIDDDKLFMLENTKYDTKCSVYKGEGSSIEGSVWHEEFIPLRLRI